MSEAFRFGSTNVSRETFESLAGLRELVRRWNGTVKLVSTSDLAILDQRHIANSLCLLPLLEQLRPKSVMDIGSGGGFPGLVVAIATGVHVHLVESDQRKAAFLREAARLLSAGVTVHAERVETIEITVDIVTSRAFAPLDRLWPIVADRLAPSGRGLFLAGERVVDDARVLDRHGMIWRFTDGTVFEVPAR